MSFAIVRARTLSEASALARDKAVPLTVLKAGGMDVVDHLKEGLYEPNRLIDILHVGEEEAYGLREGWIGALRTLADIGNSPEIRRSAPAIAQACHSAATPQIRNVATAAGNLLQRPRCWYYRNDQFNCLKKGGATCFAVEGENQYHAIFGGGPCHIVHPSNLAVALWVCDANVHFVGGSGDALRLKRLFHLPGVGVTTEHVLQNGEVITHVTYDPRPHSAFYAVKHKQSFDWPLVAAAVSLELDGTVIRRAQVCAGAVAPIPWQLEHVERALAGVDVNDDAALRAACDRAREGAKPMTANAYKVTLLPVAVRRATRMAAGLEAIA